MNSTARNIDDHQSKRPDLLLVLRCRAEARAHLVANGLHDLLDSVDTLQADAERWGLVQLHGQDEVQRILSESFARWRV